MPSDPVAVGERAREIAAQIEQPEALEGKDEQRRALLFREAELDENIHRDPERLRAVWTDSDSVAEAAAELDCSPTTASKWLEAFGIRARARQDLEPHEVLRRHSPTELGFEELPEGEA